MRPTASLSTTPTSRRAVLLGGAAGAGLAASPLLAGPAVANTGAISVVTANVRYRLPWDQYIVDLDRAAYAAHLLGVNEGYSHPAEIKYWAEARGFHCYQPDGDASTNVMLARKSMFDPVAADWRLGTGQLGGSKPKPTFVTWAGWREKQTGLVIWHINSHLPPGIDRGGRPTDSHGDGRLQEAIGQLVGVQTLAQNLRNTDAEVIVTGDFNIDFRRDRAVKDPRFPYRMYEHGGSKKGPELRSCYSLFRRLKGDGTHGKPGKRRWIDYVYEWVRTPSKRRIAMTDYQIVDLLHSDHDAVLAQFAINTEGHANG